MKPFDRCSHCFCRTRCCGSWHIQCIYCICTLELPLTADRPLFTCKKHNRALADLLSVIPSRLITCSGLRFWVLHCTAAILKNWFTMGTKQSYPNTFSWPASLCRGTLPSKYSDKISSVYNTQSERRSLRLTSEARYITRVSHGSYWNKDGKKSVFLSTAKVLNLTTATDTRPLQILPLIVKA